MRWTSICACALPRPPSAERCPSKHAHTPHMTAWQQRPGGRWLTGRAGSSSCSTLTALRSAAAAAPSALASANTTPGESRRVTCGEDGRDQKTLGSGPLICGPRGGRRHSMQAGSCPLQRAWVPSPFPGAWHHVFCCPAAHAAVAPAAESCPGPTHLLVQVHLLHRLGHTRRVADLQAGGQGAPGTKRKQLSKEGLFLDGLAMA